MLNGINLTLLIGPVVPIPVPQVVLDALTRITVTSATQEASGFQLEFTLSNRSPLHTIFLLGGSTPVTPFLRVVIVVTMRGQPTVLMDGLMTSHEVQPGTDSGHSTLVVKGLDMRHIMTQVDLSGLPFPAMPYEARVALILAKYLVFGLIPLIIPAILPEVPNPLDIIPSQRGTDLDYLQQMAEEVGYVFYVEPGPVPGTSTAYWGPEIKIGIPQPALNINMDTFTNTESLSFTFENDRKKLPILFIHNALTKVPIPIPIPDISLINPPLGLIPPLPTGVEILDNTAKLSPIRAALRGLDAASKSSEAVKGHGKLNVLRYGHILKSRGLVGVRGAGMAFDGLYYVSKVTHNLKRGEYTQDFDLSRNGLVSTFPQVPV